ncbi:MAG: hypothetical protein CVU48_09755 [Candidatus Cloacimonetes bacterium HGW-Cloacimonetes-1]|jgi:hypothetical protein|nr:MAG: hypothetical protein CVU48_09755 [Candidatus Cloacimonetes bacterium HGW-Cloacimonetes-1]
MNLYLLAAIEWAIMLAAIIILYPIIGFMGLLGLFLAFVGFELHLIWHRIDRERKQEKKKLQ